MSSTNPPPHPCLMNPTLIVYGPDCDYNDGDQDGSTVTSSRNILEDLLYSFGYFGSSLLGILIKIAFKYKIAPVSP